MQPPPYQPPAPPPPPSGGRPPWIPPPPGPPHTAGGGSPWAVVAAVVVGLWAVGVTLVAQAVGWLADQLLLVSGLPRPGWLWSLVALGNGLLVALPAGLLARLPRSAAIRAAGRVWLLGGFAVGGFGTLRAIPMPHHELYLAALALTAGVAALVLRRRSPRPDRSAPAGTLLGVAAGLALLLPWLGLGALGGALETLLAGAAAAAVGWLAATILGPGFWSPYQTGSGMRLVLLGGLVAGAALLLLAAGAGQSGTQLAAMLVLPPAGFAAAALRRQSKVVVRRYADHLPTGGGAGGATTGWLVGLAAFGPLAFADPEEISLLLSMSRDVPFWVTIAAVGSLVGALLLGFGYAILFTRRRAPIVHRWVGAAAAAVLLLAAGAVYFGVGQPGLHGEKLFVVLREQADLSGIEVRTGPAGRDRRVREVHQRLVDTARRTQADLHRELERWRLDHTPYYLVNAIEVEGGPAVRAWLARHPDVDRVLLSQQLRPLPARPKPERGTASAPTRPTWNLTMIGADRVWAQLGANGSGIVVGGSDSGVDGGHPALADTFRGGDDSWYDPWNHTRAPTDNGGHGTHTLGTAVGRQNIGVAPGASWVACVNLDRNLGNPARYLDCLQFMLAPFPPGGDPFADGRPERAPHVLTNSWACPAIEGCDATALRPATDALAAAGIFVVAAAGNTGPFCDSVDDPPAPYPDVLTIGAVDRNRRVTEFSSRGPAPEGVTKPDVVAPGAGVLSAMPGGGYTPQDGTSMATPHVAGVVALMWSAEPALIGDLDRTGQILRDTATPADPSYLSDRPADRCGGDANIRGAGLVNAFAAVQATLSQQ
ncbi:MAG TPA: S8 family serine peptidase [Micromonospora sp.]|nr:S8 family serine peptidase [Micromonospora sp.]